MSTLIQVDARKRISLGSLAHHEQYIATEQADGSLLLEPAIVLTAAEHAFLEDKTLSAALAQVNANPEDRRQHQRSRPATRSE
ncbi:hypothetical protein [Microbacterium paludicola]|uniref:hypothetical protein n=1 Tax=Microbacterium paludicola TaxID=300019 RepID=UPI00090445B9|nr:hypothetical protein [Microbacterium paludicola]APF34912.1 hypothetical protein BO218_12545 [Microbacterium paludicola]